jgi:hypothetical protein
VDLSVVLIFAGVMIGGFTLGALLIIIRPRDDEAASLYRRQAGDAWAWLQDRVRASVSRMPSRSARSPRQ